MGFGLGLGLGLGLGCGVCRVLGAAADLTSFLLQCVEDATHLVRVRARVRDSV